MTATRNRGAGGVAAHAGGVSRTAKTRSETMRVGLLGRKVGMTQVYQEDGTSVPVTVLECGPCTVLQVRTEERDGYHAVQLGFDDKKRKSATQPERGHARKVNAEPKRYVREVRQTGPADVTEGQTLTVEVLGGIKRVDVTGTSKGRGYSGVIKRHGFRGLRATHGVKRMHRHPGSSGPSADPSRTQKGIRKPGQFGNARSTVRNLEVVRIDPANNLLLLKGAVPGPNGGYLTICQTNKV
jgi:large subunit ribosomal protein L3